MARDPLTSFLASRPAPLRPLSAAEVDAQLEPLRSAIAGALGEDALARLVIPAAFRRFLESAGGGQLGGDPTFWSLASMVESTSSWLCHVDRKELYDPCIFVDGGPLAVDEEPADGPWIHFATYGDKRWLFLCCDREHPEFGHVAEGYDSTPWVFAPGLDFSLSRLSGEAWDDPDPPDARWTFAAFLALLQAQS
ncbi:MAG: hypothetical protein R3A79_26675 [Nannocystaceae bacterium]